MHCIVFDATIPLLDCQITAPCLSLRGTADKQTAMRLQHCTLLRACLLYLAFAAIFSIYPVLHLSMYCERFASVERAAVTHKVGAGPSDCNGARSSVSLAYTHVRQKLNSPCLVPRDNRLGSDPGPGPGRSSHLGSTLLVHLAVRPARRGGRSTHPARLQRSRQFLRTSTDSCRAPRRG